MTGNPDDRTTGDEVETTEVERTQASAGVAREPLVSGDPLGLGGEPDPDAPSRRPEPKVLSLAGEFLRMSRATAILLAAFVLVGALYLLVKEEPVVNLAPREPAVPTEAETSSSTTPTEGTESSGTTEPTSPTEETTSPTGITSTTEVPTQRDDDEVSESPTRNTAPANPPSAVPGTTGTGDAAPTGAGTPDGQQGGGAAGGGASPANGGASPDTQ